MVASSVVPSSAGRGAGQVQAAASFPTGGQPGLGFQLFIQADAVLQHAGDIAFGSQLPHQTGGMPGRPAGQLTFLDNDNILAAHLGQVIGRTAPDNSATDDDDAHQAPSAAGASAGGPPAGARRSVPGAR